VNAANNVMRGNRVRRWRGWQWLGAAMALAAAEPATAQAAVNTSKESVTAAAAPRISIDVLKGTWVRPDGGYTIAIRSIDPNGRIEATYFNPNPLPFAKAQALPEGTSLRVFFELQAGGYAGSTYELTYDPASDRLKGTYYQAVVKQKFDVNFLRN
jgi:hypothetical protein